MPHFSDNIHLGPAKILQPPNPGDPSPMELGVGPMGRVYLWDVIPTVPAANNVALSQATVGANQQLVLTAGAGTSTRVGTDNKGVVVLDVPRCLVVAGTLGAPFIVRGLDQYGSPMTENLAAAGTTKKAFKAVISITAAVAGTLITVGTSSIIGLPYRLTDVGYWISAKISGVNGQFATAPTLADQTDPATSTTGDVRGTIDLGASADGVKRFVALIALPGIACGPNATRVGAAGVMQV
jgi:hypothetical protein